MILLFKTVQPGSNFKYTHSAAQSSMNNLQDAPLWSLAAADFLIRNPIGHTHSSSSHAAVIWMSSVPLDHAEPPIQTHW